MRLSAHLQELLLFWQSSDGPRAYPANESESETSSSTNPLILCFFLGFETFFYSSGAGIRPACTA